MVISVTTNQITAYNNNYYYYKMTINTYWYTSSTLATLIATGLWQLRPLTSYSRPIAAEFCARQATPYIVSVGRAMMPLSWRILDAVDTNDDQSTVVTVNIHQCKMCTTAMSVRQKSMMVYKHDVYSLETWRGNSVHWRIWSTVAKSRHCKGSSIYKISKSLPVYVHVPVKKKTIIMATLTLTLRLTLM